MSERSLTASATGTEKARRALRNLNMTQKALVNERGIASWSTINRFFNGIAIDREIFINICEELNLNWQDIAAPFSEQAFQKLTPLEKLWQKLQALGSVTEQMGLVLVKEETLRWGWEANSRYEKSVPIGSYIQFEINFDTPGYLLLIQKDTSGQVWCFCPSCFAPQPHLNTGKTSLPQQGSPITSFPIEGMPGKEIVLAIITEQNPVLNWLPTGDAEPLQLTENHLNELIDFVNPNENCQVLYTEYEVK